MFLGNSSLCKGVDRSLLLPFDLTVEASGCRFETFFALPILPPSVEAGINKFAIVDVGLDHVSEAELGAGTVGMFQTYTKPRNAFSCSPWVSSDDHLALHQARNSLMLPHVSATQSLWKYSLLHIE